MKNLLYLPLFVFVFGTVLNSNAQKQYKELTNLSFEALNDGAVATADVNGDGYEDVLMIGQNESYEEVAILYLKDASGNYTEVKNTPFVEVELGALDFADVNGNGLPDVLITGLTAAGQTTAKLYINKGNGDFVEDTHASFEGVYYSSIAFADVDGNGSQDVLITGLNALFQPISKLYTNDGNGKFKEKSTSFEASFYGDVAFADANGNKNIDLLICGKNTTGKLITQLYMNDGNGNFNAVASPFVGMYNGEVSFLDVDENGSLDVLLNDSNNHQVVYINNGQAKFEEVKSTH